MAKRFIFPILIHPLPIGSPVFHGIQQLPVDARTPRYSNQTGYSTHMIHFLSICPFYAEYLPFRTVFFSRFRAYFQG